MSNELVVSEKNSNTNSNVSIKPANKLVVTDSQIFKIVNTGPWQGLEEIKFEKLKTPLHKWMGKKIPATLWKQILSFFQWSYNETKSETVVNLFYHDVKGWVALVLPQEAYSGMTIKTLPNHPKVAETYTRLGEGWGVLTDEGHVTGVMMGTVHHHCGAAAFQSGTDRADEITSEGLHITIGNLDAPKYSIHGRTSYNGLITEANYTEWFQLPNAVVDLVPEEFHQEALKSLLTKKPKDIVFPDWWKENLIKVERVQNTIGYAGMYGSNGSYQGGYGQSGGHYYNNHSIDDLRGAGGSSVSDHKRNKKKHKNHSHHWWFENQLNEYCRSRNTTYKEILAELASIPDNLMPILGFMQKTHKGPFELSKDIHEIQDSYDDSTENGLIVTS